MSYMVVGSTLPFKNMFNPFQEKMCLDCFEKSLANKNVLFCFSLFFLKKKNTKTSKKNQQSQNPKRQKSPKCKTHHQSKASNLECCQVPYANIALGDHQTLSAMCNHLAHNFYQVRTAKWYHRTYHSVFPACDVPNANIAFDT